MSSAQSQSASLAPQAERTSCCSRPRVWPACAGAADSTAHSPSAASDLALEIVLSLPNAPWHLLLAAANCTGERPMRHRSVQGGRPVREPRNRASRSHPTSHSDHRPNRIAAANASPWIRLEGPLHAGHRRSSRRRNIRRYSQAGIPTPLHRLELEPDILLFGAEGGSGTGLAEGPRASHFLDR